MPLTGLGDKVESGIAAFFFGSVGVSVFFIFLVDARLDSGEAFLLFFLFIEVLSALGEIGMSNSGCSLSVSTSPFLLRFLFRGFVLLEASAWDA